MMGRLSLWPALVGLALAMILVTFVEPTKHALSYAAGGLVIISLLGWVMEARAVAGPAPAVEPEHEEEEEEAPGPSYWPVLLAVGIVGIATGLVYGWEYLSLLIAVPLLLGAGGAWASVIQRDMLVTPAQPGTELEPLSAAPMVSGGRVLAPIPPRALAAQAAGGAAIAIERVEAEPVSRRTILRTTFWAGLGAGIAAIAGSTVDFLYPRGVTGFGGVVSAGAVDEFAPGTKRRT